MPSDKTMTMLWYYTTPCGRCGKDIRIEQDESRGKAKYGKSATVKLKCKSCGHEDSYPATAVDNKLVG